MRARLLLLILVCGLVFFAGLGRPAITDSDEAFYAEAAREMVRDGDWLTPHYNDEVRFQKPVLFYWLAAATYEVAGVTEAAARFWAAIAGLGLVLVTFAAGRRWYGERVGLLAGLITATSFGAFFYARQALPDLPLAFFVVLSTWTGIVAIVDRPARPAAWLIASAAAAGLAFLTKGPLGVVLPGLVVGAVMLVERRHVRLARGQVALAAAVFLATAAPWYVAMWRVHGDAYLRSFFIADNLERFATTRFNDPRNPFFYVGVLLGGLTPWSPFLLLLVPPAVRVLRRARAVAAVEWRLVAWAALPFVLFTASVGKQPRYILPVLPPVVILVAVALERRLAVARRRAAPRPDGLIAVCGTLAGVLVLLLGWALYQLRPLLLDVSDQAVGWTCRAIWAGAGAVVAASWSRHLRLVPAVVAGAAVVALVGGQYVLLSSPGPAPVEQAAALIRAHLGPDDTWTAHGENVFVRNLVFYVRRPESQVYDDGGLVDLLRGPRRVVMSLPEEQLAGVEARAGVRLVRLGEVMYFNTAALTLGRLLSPDPRRDLKAVLIVATPRN